MCWLPLLRLQPWRGGGQLGCPAPLGSQVGLGALHRCVWGFSGAAAILAAEVRPQLRLWRLLGPGVVGVGTVGEFPKKPLSASFFLFQKFLLYKPAVPNKCLASYTARFSNQSGDYLGQGP